MNIVYIYNRPFSSIVESGFRQRVGCIMRLLLSSERVKRFRYVWWNEEPFAKTREQSLAARPFQKLKVYESRRLAVPFLRRVGIQGQWLSEFRVGRLARKLSDVRSNGALWIWANDPRLAYSLRSLADRLGGRLVFDLIDNFSRFPGHREGQKAEYEMAYQKVADAADQVFTNSHLLAEFMQAKGARVKPVPNGVDWERFHQTLANKPAEPLELAAIPHPRIGFVGILSSVTDHTLLDRVAEEVPEAQVVLIGSAIGKAEPLHSRIHQFGMKSYEEIPDYLAGLDAGLLIYRLCEGTLYNDPLKTYEYLAAGLPVVATNAQEHLRKLAHVQMANNANEFVSTVRRLVAEKTSPAEAEARSQSVRMHDWKYRSQEMLDTLSRAPTKPIV